MTATLADLRATAAAPPPALVGRAEARLATPPLRELTPETSLGFEAITFAEQVLGVDLLTWQRYWLIHALELKPDGTFRFRTVVTLLARQQGKTFLLKIVALWAMYLGRANLVLGAAQSLDIARESWQGAVELATGSPHLSPEVGNVRQANGEQCLTLTSGARYRIAAATRSAGRGLSVDLLILDELREHRSWEAWGALSKTTMARPNALTVTISNAGDDQSIVLNSLRAAALAGTDVTLGIFEWSAPEGCALDDQAGWVQSMPGLGSTITEAAIRTALATDPPAVFRTELLCQHVDALDAAIDPAAWKLCEDASATLASVRDRIVYALDVAPDGQHVTLCGAAVLDDGRIRGEVFGGWGPQDGATATDRARRALPGLLDKLRPRALGWFPSGPAAVLGVDLGHQHGVTIGRWNIPRDAMLDQAPGLIELTGAAVTEACQSLADVTTGRLFLHSGDPLLNAHVTSSMRLMQGDGWRFVRRGAGHVDAAYAMAGAVRLARLLPAAAPAERPAIF